MKGTQAQLYTNLHQAENSQWLKQVAHKHCYQQPQTPRGLPGCVCEGSPTRYKLLQRSNAVLVERSRQLDWIHYHSRTYRHVVASCLHGHMTNIALGCVARAGRPVKQGMGTWLVEITNDGWTMA